MLRSTYAWYIIWQRIPGSTHFFQGLANQAKTWQRFLPALWPGDSPRWHGWLPEVSTSYTLPMSWHLLDVSSWSLFCIPIRITVLVLTRMNTFYSPGVEHRSMRSRLHCSNAAAEAASHTSALGATMQLKLSSFIFPYKTSAMCSTAHDTLCFPFPCEQLGWFDVEVSFVRLDHRDIARGEACED